MCWGLGDGAKNRCGPQMVIVAVDAPSSSLEVGPKKNQWTRSLGGVISLVIKHGNVQNSTYFLDDMAIELRRKLPQGHLTLSPR